MLRFERGGSVVRGTRAGCLRWRGGAATAADAGQRRDDVCDGHVFVLRRFLLPALVGGRACFGGVGDQGLGLGRDDVQ
jgi:hypothetical protein